MKNQFLWACLPKITSNANNLSIGKFYDYSGKFYDYFYIYQAFKKSIGKFYDYFYAYYWKVLRLPKINLNICPIKLDSFIVTL